MWVLSPGVAAHVRHDLSRRQLCTTKSRFPGRVGDLVVARVLGGVEHAVHEPLHGLGVTGRVRWLPRTDLGNALLVGRDLLAVCRPHVGKCPVAVRFGLRVGPDCGGFRRARAPGSKRDRTVGTTPSDFRHWAPWSLSVPRREQ